MDRSLKAFSIMRFLLLSAALCFVMSACQSPAPSAAQPASPVPAADYAAEYAALAKSESGTVYALDAAASTVRIYVFRGGAAAKVGHNHIFAAPQLEGRAFVSKDGAVGKSRFDVRVRLDQLTLDDPSWRAGTGGGFAGERSQSDIEGTRRNMLGKKGLQADAFPFVTLKSMSVSGDWPVLVADVAVTLHGVTRTQAVLLRVQRGADRLQASGSLVLKQSDFGIEPFSVLGGLLAVQDDVAVSFDLVGNPAP